MTTQRTNLTTCPDCMEIALRRTTPHGESYVFCSACGAITFDGDLEIAIALPSKPDPGAAIVRQWATDRAYFLQTLSNLTSEDICQMARAAVAHCARRVPWAPVTVDQMLAAWQAAAEGVTS